MKFILSRTADCRNHSKKWIVGYALLFWIVTRIIAAAILMGCVAVYHQYGISPEKLTSFGGDPTLHSATIMTLIVLLVIAPFLEEGLFRLGLSFKKWQVALSLSLIPVAVLWMNYLHYGAVGYVVCLACAIIIFCGLNYCSSQNWWSSLKRHYLVSFMWLTSVAFGLMHFLAFSEVTWQLVPYCFCVTLVPFFAGCTCAYLRVNLGFWWGVGMHVFNNLPPVLMLLMR